jgi:rare lipoprotein A
MCCASIALTACSTHRDAAPTEQADFAPSPSILAPWQDATPRPDPLLAEGNRSPYEVNGARYAVRVSAQGYRERGVASWYGMKFQGRPTANGEIFDVYGATAAHRSLPIPTYVRVTNLGNDRTVVLRVNDRGPFHPDRLIDLSYGAALQLGFAEQGTASVLVESLDLAGVDDRRELKAATYRYLQLGAYSSESAAGELSSEISSTWAYPVSVSAVDTDGRRLHRVRVGPFDDMRALERARAVLIEAGYPAPQPLP